MVRPISTRASRRRRCSRKWTGRARRQQCDQPQRNGRPSGGSPSARKQRFDSSRKSHVYGAVGSNDFGQQRQPSSAVPAPCVEGCGKNVAVISSGLTLITLVRTPLGLNVEANFASPAGDAVARAERQSPRACAQYPLRSVSAALSIRVSSDRWGRRSPRG